MSIRREIEQYMTKWNAEHPGEPLPSGSKIAADLRRPQSYSSVYKILRDLQQEGVQVSSAPPPPPRSHENYAPRGATRIKVQQYLDDHPGTELSSVEMAAELGLNAKTVGQAMRDILRQRAGRSPRWDKTPRKPVTDLAVVPPATPAPARAAKTVVLTPGNGLPDGVFVRVQGRTRHTTTVVRDGDNHLYELREL